MKNQPVKAWSLIRAGCFVACLMWSAGPLCGEPVDVPMANAGFESPALTFPGASTTPVDGWFSNPEIEVVLPGPGMPDASEGSQYAWAGSVPDFVLNQFHGPLLPDTEYTFSVDLRPVWYESASVVVQLLETTTQTVLAEKLWNPPSNPGVRQFDLPANQWTTLQLSFNTADHPSSADQPLLIQIRGAYLAIDHARLSRELMISASGQYFVSSSEGNDANNGLSPATAWRSFAPVNSRLFEPGSAIFLKRGDVWNEELNLRGNGSAEALNHLTSYGSGPKPLIFRSDRDYDKCVVLHNGSHWRIEGIAARNAALGVFLRYFKHLGAEAVTVENCDFADMDSWLIDAATRGYEWAIPAAVWVGGLVPSGAGELATVLDGLTIRNCSAENCTAGFGSGWYFPALHRARLTNMLIEDCYATQVSIGGLALNSVSNSIIRRFRTFKKCGKPGGFIWGSTGGIISTSENVTFEDCEFSDTDRMWPDRTKGDGSGFDIDGNNHNIVMRRCLFHDNEGPGLLFLSTYGIANTSILIEDCTFWNNATDASDDTYAPGGNAYEIKISGGAASGVIRNCGLFRGTAATDWIDAGIQNTVSIENPRLGWWSALDGRLATPEWEWNTTDAEGWSGWNQWTPVVSGGQLSGVSSGIDSSGKSPLLWSNTLRSTPLVRLRLRADSGTAAQLFFITEHDSQWDSTKSVGVPLIADGNWHDYTVDLRASPGYTGVITQLRLDPTDMAGTSFGIDHLRIRPVIEDIRPTIRGIEGKGVHVGFFSDPGAAFLLMRSTNLQQWDPVDVLTTDRWGNAGYFDESVFSEPRRFYRLEPEP